MPARFSCEHYLCVRRETAPPIVEIERALELASIPYHATSKPPKPDEMVIWPYEDTAANRDRSHCYFVVRRFAGDAKGQLGAAAAAAALHARWPSVEFEVFMVAVLPPPQRIGGGA